MNCSFTSDELVEYRTQYDQLEQTLIVKKNGGKSAWNLVSQRSLALLTMCLRLPEIDNKTNLKASNQTTILDTPDHWASWMNKPDARQALFWLLWGAPKARAFLRNIRSQVLLDSYFSYRIMLIISTVHSRYGERPCFLPIPGNVYLHLHFTIHTQSKGNHSDGRP